MSKIFFFSHKISVFEKDSGKIVPGRYQNFTDICITIPVEVAFNTSVFQHAMRNSKIKIELNTLGTAIIVFLTDILEKTAVYCNITVNVKSIFIINYYLLFILCALYSVQFSFIKVLA
jgi:hypothetical protein